MNLTAPSPIKTKNYLYIINNRLDEKNKKIILSCHIESNLSPFYYEISLGLDDFKKLNKNFKVYDDIIEINSFINENIQEKKIIIKKEEVNEENLKLSFVLYNLKGIVENVEIKLEKKELGTNEIIKELMKHVNKLNMENKNLKLQLDEAKDKINSLKNIIRHKMDSLIIEDEKEQKFLENRLNKIKIFSGKNLLTRLLFRATIHGDKASTFHNLCDYKNNLLFLVKTTKNYRFGGFTTVSISESKDSSTVMDNDAFCFSFNLSKIYNIIKNKEAIWIKKDEIITFLRDIFKIYDNFFKNESKCDDSRDGNKYICYDGQNKKYEINGGEKTFFVQELEVFEIIFF